MDGDREVIPFPDSVLTAGGNIYLFDTTFPVPNGDANAIFHATGVEIIQGIFGSDTAYLYILDTVLINEAAPVIIDLNVGVHFGFDGTGQQESVTTTTDRRVWVAQTERGANIGILSIGVSQDQELTVNQETAEFVTRYEADLALGTSITDDLGRVWEIYSSRTSDDRRFLFFEGRRNVIRAME